ncbi:hypothetical protein ACFSM7_02535 [Clavibacter michiganensis subsp. tessellarius]
MFRKIAERAAVSVLGQDDFGLPWAERRPVSMSSPAPSPAAARTSRRF